MAVDYVDRGNDDGMNFGRSDGKIGFYGLTTPIVKQTITVKATVTTGTDAFTNIIADVTAIVDALAALGLITKA